MKTVYVFGAGASCRVGYPLASDFGVRLFDYMLGSPDSAVQGSAEVLIEAFGKKPNVEDLITELLVRTDALINSTVVSERIERTRLGIARGRLVDSIQQWFRKIRQNDADAYAAFSGRIVDEGDSVITFNYDDSLERELKRHGKWDISQGYGFSLSSNEVASAVTVLKLHGSINWLLSYFGGATGGAFLVNPTSSMGDHPVIHEVDLEYLGYRDFSGYKYRSGGASPCLILPGRQKDFYFDTSMGKEYEWFWNGLWSQAAHLLRECDRLVVCGYSLLPVDRRACELLLNQPKKNVRIEIASGNQTERIAGDFKAAGFSAVHAFKSGYFEDWVRSQDR